MPCAHGRNCTPGGVFAGSFFRLRADEQQRHARMHTAADWVELGPGGPMVVRVELPSVDGARATALARFRIN